MRTMILCLALLTGCATYDLGDDYPPLSKIVERPSLSEIGVSDTTLTTKGSHVYVGDLDKFLNENPPGTTPFIALMKHEQVHGKRQFGYLGLPGEMALTAWISRYAVDHNFMWAEEQQGYYAEIKHLDQHGMWSYTDTISTASAMSGGVYKTILGKRMVSFENAKGWIMDVLSGHWTP